MKSEQESKTNELNMKKFQLFKVLLFNKTKFYLINKREGNRGFISRNRLFGRNTELDENINTAMNHEGKGRIPGSNGMDETRALIAPSFDCETAGAQGGDEGAEVGEGSERESCASWMNATAGADRV